MKTKVEKLTTVPCELEITEATLLSVEEAKALLTVEDRVCGSLWWLRSPGCYQRNATRVSDDGYVDAVGYDVSVDYFGVRPALQIANLKALGLKIGDEFYLWENRFKIISDHLALCNSIVGYTRFDAKSNDYERSEIKKYVDHWFDELMNRGTDA